MGLFKNVEVSRLGVRVPRLYTKNISMRAINNYNGIGGAVDNMSFVPEDAEGPVGEKYFGQNVERARIAVGGNMVVPGHIYTAEDGYDYPTLASRSSRSVVSSGTDLRKDDLGSTAKLISPKFSESCRSCLYVVETIFCTVSLGAGLGNLYRLPQSVVAHGGLPFLVAYLALVILVGFPLLFLELGIGQIVQDGFMKTWRAVPFFRGVGYIKLLSGWFLSIYYPLYMGLSLYYLIWFARESPPFSECAQIKMTENGYKADGVSGQECVRKTFLESPIEDPYWFGIYACLLFLIWFVIMAWCIKRSKTYEKALIVFLLCTVSCLIALIAKAIDTNQFQGIKDFGTNVDWSVLAQGEVWYFALIQVFFSTNIGFGVFTSNAGIIYKKTNPFWTSLCYIFINLTIGILSVLLFYSISNNIDPVPHNVTISEIHIITHIYDMVLQSEEADMQIWSVVAYMTILFAGFISMITIMYTIIKAVSMETKNKLRWWQLSLIISFMCFLLGCLILFCPNLDILHLLDHYIVGNLILITVFLEVLAFMLFYGPTRLQSDFEFILGNSLSKFWISLWYFCPVLIAAIVIWGLSTMSLTGLTRDDDLWIYATGWSVVIASVVFILILGLCNITQQEEYFTICDKVKASFKLSRKWGPSDPMMRHNWKQWHSKAQDGERDFTLKRRGTKEYTHSIKNKSKYHGKGYTPTISDTSTISGTLTYKKSNPLDPTLISNGYSEPYYTRNGLEKPLRVTSVIDVMDPTPTHSYSRPKSHNGVGYKTNYNPLAYINSINVNGYNEPQQNDGSTSEGYGTYRKGPYIIEDDGSHVCHRRNSVHEQATEL